MDWNNCIADKTRLLTKHYNSGRSGASIQYIVVHHNAGVNLTVDDCWNIWQNRQASAHYQVQSDGLIGQLVNDWDTAWHAGDWNANCRSIGIEHANNCAGPWTISDQALEAGAHLVAALCKLYGLGRPTWLGNVFPHKYFQATQCPGEIAGSQNAQYMARAQAWYDAMVNGTDPGSPAPSTPSAPNAPAGDIIPVHYALRLKNGSWLSEVTNFENTTDNGFAGVPFEEHDLLYAKVDRGTLKYRAHTLEDGWLDWVTKGDPSDTVNGCAGIAGHTIDGVQFYYVTPDGEAYHQAWYRSQTTDRSGWLPVCCDDGSTYDNYDGWAGMLGEPLDRLQLCVSTSNPF